MEDRTEPATPDATAVIPRVSRRQFIGGLGTAAVGAAAMGAVLPAADGRSSVLAQGKRGDASLYQRRAVDTFNLRVSCAQENLSSLPAAFTRPSNLDEELYPNRIGSYSKALPHQANGEVVGSAYDSMLLALNSGSPALFEQIPMGGAQKLTNPQAGYAFDLEGADAFTFLQPPPPAFASREIAAEIAENYWMALLRDVPFTEYPTSPLAAAAAADLTQFGGDFRGPKTADGQVTPGLLFRGSTSGDRSGPLMSQFWYLPCFFGANEVNQRIRTVLGKDNGGQDYMTDFSSWLNVQNGGPTAGDIFDPVFRYMRNGRDIGQWVHIDVLFQGYFQAFLIIAGLGVPFDSGNPYRNSSTQNGFATFGGPHIATLLCEVSTRALKAVWNQKWLVHRRLRPEAFAARVDRTAYHGANYPVHPEILNSISSQSRLGGYMPAGNALLPMAFPEGCPTHPAYGAGHATVAGACVTILKAWFNESTVIQDPVVPSADGLSLVPYAGDSLTVGGELNKIASNVAIGRNMAGVHWRSDATESLRLGEAVAISVLRDQKRCYNETFTGFQLTKFDGTTVTV